AQCPAPGAASATPSPPERACHSRSPLEQRMSQETARRVLRIEAQAIKDVLARLDASFDRAVEVLFACKGRVVVTGMGKSGLIGRKISGTLSSTGTPSFFLHSADALHGDLGMLARGDALLAISYGGETQEILNLLETLKRLEIAIVTLTGNLKSTLAEASDVALDVSVKEEACSLNLAPTASTTVPWPSATPWPFLCWKSAGFARPISRRCILPGAWEINFCVWNI